MTRKAKLLLKSIIKIFLVFFYVAISIFFTHEIFHLIFNISSGGKFISMGYNNSFYIKLNSPNITIFIITIIGGSLGNILFSLLLIKLIHNNILIFGGLLVICYELFYWSLPLFTYYPSDAYLFYSLINLDYILIKIVSIIFFILLLTIYMYIMYRYSKEFNKWYLNMRN